MYVDASLKRPALDHLWLHFTEMGNYGNPDELQVTVRGDGCYLEDSAGRRYPDALAGLFCVNIGYGFGEEMGEAAAAQMRELPFATNWTFAHPRSIELAAELAKLAPGDLNHAFFVALSITGCTSLRTPFEPLVPDVLHVSNTDRYHRRPTRARRSSAAFLLDELEAALDQAGPDTVATVILEPVQNSGGSFMPPAGYFSGVREICHRHGILLCADAVITGFGRLGEWFASTRFGLQPDLITCAKGLSSGYAAIGALIARERVMEPFREPATMYSTE